MGTNAAYGGSSSKRWTKVRDAWEGLPPSLLPTAPTGDGDGAPGDVPIPPNYAPPPELDRLGQALIDALARTLPAPSAPSPSLASLLARRSGGGGQGGGGGSGSSGNTGRASGRGRQVSLQAARGGAAIGAAAAYRDRDAAALAEYSITLEELDALSPRMRAARILDLVLGEAGHPDEAAVRAAALEQIKALSSEEGRTRTALSAVRAFVGDLVVRLGLVELRNQIHAGTTSFQDARRRENALKQWVASKVRTMNLAVYGTVTARECHSVAFQMARDALRLLRSSR